MFKRSSSSSEESDISQPFACSKSSFRISVCLSRYFSDVRARAYMLARRDRRVDWLQRRLRRTFQLRGAFCLRAAGHLLPPAEPLRLLREDDCVEVIPLEEAQTGIQFRKHDMKQINGAGMEQKTVTSTSIYVGTDPTSNRGCTHNHNDEPDAPLNGRVAEEQAAGDSEHSVCDDGCDERALRSLKRRALDLLDVRFGPEATDDSVAAELAPPRRRRRVRRRTRRAPTPTLARRSPTPPPARRAPTLTPTPAGSVPGDVAQNEAACARQPRMVHSLD